MLRKLIPFSLAALFLLLPIWWLLEQPAPAAAAPAATITVTSLADETLEDGNCTLREAMTAANTNAAVDACPAGGLIGADTILFSQDGTINLAHSSGELIISEAVIIEGNGRNNTTIDGLNNNRIFNITNGRSITLRHLTLQNGYADGTDLETGGAIFCEDTSLFLEDVVIQDSASEGSLAAGGGGLATHGNLTVKNSLLRNNSADNSANGGGAVLAEGGQVLVEASIIQNNRADTSFGGGGIFMSGGVLTLTNSLVEGNQSLNSLAGGGGIYAHDANVTIGHSTIQNNSAENSDLGGGGALFDGGTWSILNSTFSYNEAQQAGDGGGALYLTEGGAFIDTSTISNNNADNSDVGGGGLLVSVAAVDLVDSTVAYNRAINNPENGRGLLTGGVDEGRAATIAAAKGAGSSYGGGAHSSTNGLISFQNTLIAMNSPADCSGFSGFLISYDTNLDSDDSCDLTEPEDQPGVDPLLGPLQDNGGDTATHLPLLGSPAVDTGSCIRGFDQRGLRRPYGKACDIGSVETRHGRLYLPVTLKAP